MADDRETRAGLISGIFAVIMVVALSVMALTAVGDGGTQFASGAEQREAGATGAMRVWFRQ
jgi:hypothetical protein